MDTELLRTFLSVAECEGFSAAGRQLNLTQSTVSLQIQRLEDRTGDKLFARTSRSVALTAAGERLRPYARQILRLQEEALHVVGAERRNLQIRLGMPQEQATAYLPALLPRLARDQHELRLEITCDNSQVIVAQFEEGHLDAALAVWHGPTRTGRLLGYERMRWVAADDFRTEDHESLPLGVNPEGCIFRAHAAAALGRVGRRWHISHVSSTPTGVNLAVQAGLAVTVKTLRSVPAGCRVLEADIGLPDLGHVAIELHLSPARVGQGFQDFSETLRAVVLDGGILETNAPPGSDT